MNDTKGKQNYKFGFLNMYYSIIELVLYKNMLVRQ